MARPKRRVRQHIMESESVRLVQDILPHEWVVREYKPDYGIDLSVEIFKYIDAAKTIAETLGDFLFAQVKSLSTTEVETVKVHGRDNVAKGTLRENPAEALEIEVIKYQLETDELVTVESMGHGVPVLLFLATLDSRRLFFVCLNDYLDKVIIPSNPTYSDQGSKVIYVPVKNEITADPISLAGVRFYAKRQKFYSAFNLFEYQRNELIYICETDESVCAANLTQPKEMIGHFLRLLDRLDIWDDTEMWAVVADIRALMDQLKARIDSAPLNPDILAFVQVIWQRLVALSHNYEELCREWFLPTYLAQFLSYPEYPKVGGVSNTHE